MNQTSAILETLKKYLKAKGITYRMLADEMGLSEASIKRLFSNKTFTIQRMEKVCNFLGLDFWDLALLVKKDGLRKENLLTIEQERKLSDDPKLLAFFYFLVNGWSIPQILDSYEITEAQSTQFLLKLDRLELIELHPNNRVKLLVTKNVFWQKGGPLWTRYKKIVQDSFINSQFDSINERLIFTIGQLSEDSIKTLLKKLDEFVKHFNELAEMDVSLPINGRFSTGLAVGFRPWVFPEIPNMMKKK